MMCIARKFNQFFQGGVSFNRYIVFSIDDAIFVQSIYYPRQTTLIACRIPVFEMIFIWFTDINPMKNANLIQSCHSSNFVAIEESQITFTPTFKPVLDIRAICKKRREVLF